MSTTAVSLTLLVLKTRQLEQLREFYQALGVELSQDRHGNGPAHYAGRVGETVLEVYPLAEDAGAVDATTRLGFAVGDLGQVVEALRASGAGVTSPPKLTTWGMRAVVQDPDGRAVELYQR